MKPIGELRKVEATKPDARAKVPEKKQNSFWWERKDIDKRGD